MALQEDGLPEGARERYARSLQSRLLLAFETGVPLHPADAVDHIPTPPRAVDDAAEGGARSPRAREGAPRARAPPAGLLAGGSSLRRTASTKGASAPFLKRMQIQSPR
ncbi:hypothetical protein KFE25_011455 [Diacronema lutheri]|uniref:Uncharacterized protein n=1 Tax=Diacronema lutheri TaxID=2081491 RepID=A0A8J5XDF4_DIALT|nr:hypothetical protein KFE25_011455 [Diacronema lutheri]